MTERAAGGAGRPAGGAGRQAGGAGRPAEGVGRPAGGAGLGDGEAVVAEARRRGITRLCHLTRSANLPGILETGRISPARDLRRNGDAHRPADLLRLDGAEGRLFLSIEYPNVWYLRQAAARDRLFRGWVVLTLDMDLLARPDALFVPYNSARDRSAGARPGPAGFRALFAPSVPGRLPRTRGPRHPDWWPTDDQAEVQLTGPVPLSAVRSVLFRDEQQAAQDLFVLSAQFGMGGLLPPAVVAPEVFDAPVLSSTVRTGGRVRETPYER
ncbi:DarT ssDNA thymidine ADP-ribosyltransferase family protein [Streptomyces albus]|uniref:DarT ssDNA thymidine ADP-ribosyltransferase family protein n=1 Tax=Streptomyces albus TaxID=1888 RepID=UPI0014367A40|nr:DarT ssDNA thymidine ADP-ribosyltransferase family protein [Streptomyces albus]